jgi:hypothetical protein
MDIPSTSAVNPAAETAASAHARKAGPKESASPKQTMHALDPAKKGERGSRAAERHEDGRGLNLDLSA